MVCNIVVRPNGDIVKTKKGGYIRKFFVPGSNGSEDIVTIYSEDATKLNVEGSIDVATPSEFFFAV